MLHPLPPTPLPKPENDYPKGFFRELKKTPVEVRSFNGSNKG
jgi:hypothetical protein